MILKRIDFMDLQVGASYRIYDLRSNGTIFADGDGNDITISEIGGYAQATKRLLKEKLKLIGSLRYDKMKTLKGNLVLGFLQYSPKTTTISDCPIKLVSECQPPKPNI